ncbi:hypothetical protein JYU34_012574 [Plutella xylostella]|uniref:Transcription factor Adf-1 n=1 Tax=Plutella xylostella TaxID=51655 RepID=A0ABQ7QBM5_PLUXY|nr:hypothetical protein JYU34_012574 [Plutella xylostella]
MALPLTFDLPVNVFSLIDEVRKRPVLWDTDNRRDTYTHAAAMSAWKEISEIVGIDEEKCKTKWKHMRDSFRRLKRFQATKPNHNSSKWRYYKRLRFLEPQIKLGTGIRRRRNQEEMVYESGDEDNREEPVTIKFEPSELRRSMPQEVMVQEPLTPAGTHREYDALGMGEPVLSDDEYNLMFLKSLLPFLRRLDPLRSLVVRNKLQEILFAEIKEQESLE